MEERVLEFGKAVIKEKKIINRKSAAFKSQPD